MQTLSLAQSDAFALSLALHRERADKWKRSGHSSNARSAANGPLLFSTRSRHRCSVTPWRWQLRL